jgi:hypothetical protein
MPVPIALGGFDEKAAAAYLYKPKKKKKNKKKKKKATNAELRQAKFAAAVAEKRAEMQQKLRDQDLGGGWNPLNQPVSE